MDVWNLSDRRAAILPALQELYRQERIPATVLTRIEQLYTKGRDFAAERLTGLAIHLTLNSCGHILVSE